VAAVEHPGSGAELGINDAATGHSSITILTMRKQPESDDKPEWLDLRALQRYACVSERTLRGWIHGPANPLPAVRVGAKLLVRRSTFDAWLEAHQVTQIDVDSILDDMMTTSKTEDE